MVRLRVINGRGPRAPVLKRRADARVRPEQRARAKRRVVAQHVDVRAVVVVADERLVVKGGQAKRDGRGEVLVLLDEP